MGLVDESTSTGQHAPEPQIADLPPEPAAAAPEAEPEPSPEVEDDGTSLLSLVGPFWVTSYTCKDSAGDTLVVTQSGVRVLSSDVPALISEAAASGVHLSQGK